MIMLNVVQIGIIIFLASDFFKRDRKLNTSEVYYIRSMTNATYLSGKALGIFIIFAGLNLIVLFIAAVIHALFSDITFNWRPYVIYPLIMGFPAFIFMIGMAFLMMRLIKNQAIVVLLLLGYYALVLFYLYDKGFYVFDFIGMKLPLIFSDFTGVVNWNLILMQRSLYFLIGCICLFLSILFFYRLPQSAWVKRALIALTFFLLSTSLVLAARYMAFHYTQQELRSRMRSLNDQYLEKDNISTLSCHIEIHHLKNSIQATSWHSITNQNRFPLMQFFFSINPGLTINNIRYQGKSVSFKKMDHIVVIQVENALNPNEIDTISISYSGTIEEAACYLDINEQTRSQSFNIWLFQSPRKYAFLENNFVLLSPECMWYPRAGLPVGAGFPNRMQKHFIPYTLEVHTKSNLTALSQGETKSAHPGYYKYETDFPVADISLVIGPYQKQAIQVDSIDYQLFSLPNHDYYSEYFSEIGDTLGYIIREIVQDYEVRLNLEFPFRRLNLIEVPIQYYVYPRVWSVAQEVVQPEQIWIQENAASLIGADFKQIKRSMERRLDRSNQTFTEIESQISILKSFLNYTFCGKRMQRLRFGGPSVEYRPDYNIFPNYYTHVTYLKTPDWGVFNSALEAYLYDRVHAGEENQPLWMVEGLTDAEKVSQALRDKSLAEHLNAPEPDVILPELIKQKGAYIVKLLQYETGSQSFDDNLSEIIETNWFNNFQFETFTQGLSLGDDFELTGYLQDWYNGQKLAAYLVFDVELFKVLDRNRIRNQLLFKIYNSKDIDGLIEVSFQFGRRGRGMPVGGPEIQDPPRPYKIEPMQIKKIAILLDDEPRIVNINFLVAQNIPLVFSKQFEKAELNERRSPYDGEQILSESILLLSPNEIIVDNEDEGFEIFNPTHSSILRRLIHGEKQEDKEEVYDRFRWWRPPNQWTLIKNATFFGEYIHSANYIRPGSGSKYVVWKAQIEEGGVYDIYTYMFSKEGIWRGRGNRGNITFGDFNYVIYHDAGSDKVTLSADDAQEGWNFLGTWYLSAGEVQVLLTDESNGRVIIADAIKWIKN
jgi:hypothetical protein